MTRVYKIKFVHIKTGQRDIACVDAETQEQAKSKLVKRFREVAVSSIQVISKPRTYASI